jgi:hypothetical protein
MRGREVWERGQLRAVSRKQQHHSRKQRHRRLPVGGRARGPRRRAVRGVRCWRVQADTWFSIVSGVCIARDHRRTGQDVGTCVACAAGTYKSTPGSQECTLCSGNSSHTQTAQTAASACQQHGYTVAEACSGCDAGKYKVTPGADACTSCPVNSESLASSVGPQDCLCVAGYEVLVYDQTTKALVCNAGPLGKYKSESDNFACMPCQNHSSTISTGSTDIGDCLCNAGYQPQASQCSACPAGTYKADWDNIACSDCPQNSFSMPASTL